MIDGAPSSSGPAEQNNLLWASNLMPGWREPWRRFCAATAALVTHAGWLDGAFRVRWDRPLGPEIEAFERQLAGDVAAACQLCGRCVPISGENSRTPASCVRHPRIVIPKATTPTGEPDHASDWLERAWVHLENGCGEQATEAFVYAGGPYARALRAVAGYLRELGQDRALDWLDEPRAELGGEWPRARLAIAEPDTWVEVARLVRASRRTVSAGDLTDDDVRLLDEHGPTVGEVGSGRWDRGEGGTDAGGGAHADGGHAESGAEEGPAEYGRGERNGAQG